MYEIKAGRHLLHDGTEIRTFKRDIIHANMLEAEAGTTGFRGGDSGHGGRTYFRIVNTSSTDIEVQPFGTSGIYGFEVTLGGDSELITIIEALKFIVKVLEEEKDNIE